MCVSLQFEMKGFVAILLLLLSAAGVAAQDFVGCRTGGRWAETPMLRKVFRVGPEDLKHYDFHTVTFDVDVTSLGYHELYVNGVKVGDRVLQPAVSQLDLRALTVNYDITDFIREGDNEIVLWLGQCWGRLGGTPAAAKAEVRRGVSDGECGLVYILAQTDSTWKATPSGYSYTGSWQPMQFGGERYDARVKPSWRPATVYVAKGIAVTRQEFEGNRIVDTLEPAGQTTLPDGSTLIDFGRVVTGWLQVDFPALPAGTEITMEYLDHTDAKPPFTESDSYITNGDNGRFANRFHTHAFRYVRISSHADFNFQFSVSNLIPRVLQISAVDPSGGATFECSDPRLNAIHDMVKYTLSCLTFSGYMVDCPHIERMGYGGDGNSSTNTLQTLWDVRSTYANWMQAWHDAMQPDGELPYVAPAFRTGGGPYWQGFVVKAPWRTYVNYGDRTLIYRHYDDMKRWLEYIEQHSVDYILQPWPDNERHSWFLGDWAVPERVDKGGESVLHVNSCFISECLSDMEQMARMTGHTDDARHYAEWRMNLNAAIHRHFYHPETHSYANGTPLDQAYALLQNIPPDSAIRLAVSKQLIKDCHEKYRDHIAVGLMGVPVFTEWCIGERKADLIATLIRQEDYPGYLNMINHGATTTWESWDCGRPGKDDRSRVHNCYNGIGTWFYQALAGIRPDPEQPGYKHFFIDPQPVEGVDWVKCTKPTQYGAIRVEIYGNTLKLTVPQGTTATVFPNSPNERTLQSGEWTLKIK